MHDDPYIVAHRDLMYTEGDTAHCLLFVDYDSGDGVLVESEGSNYARKSQFIPNARALLESNEMTAAETRLHNDLKKIADKVAELAHCGETSFAFDELLAESDLDVKSVLRDAVTAMLREREDIQMAESNLIPVAVTEDVVKGNISILKHSDDGSTQIETPEVGAEFEVCIRKTGRSIATLP